MARTLNPEVHTVRREAFIEAAQRLMQTNGWEQTSIQDVLDAVEASRGAFYHYFDSKQELLEAVIDRIVDAGLAVVVPIVDDASVPAIAKLERVFGGIGQWKTERKALMLALLTVWISDHNAVVREKFRRTAVARLVPILSTIIKQGVDEGIFTAESPAETARVLVMLMQGFQEEATELFVARQSNTIGFDVVERTVATYNQAFERILGAPPGSISLGDDAVLHAWFG